MNETCSDSVGSLAPVFEHPSQHILPHLALHSCIEGPCFSLEVSGVREGHELLIQHMRVIGKSLDGATKAVYVFSARIDAIGVEKLTPLLVEIRATRDTQLLYKIFQATQGHSSGDWSIEEPVYENHVQATPLLTIIPSFEEFSKDVGVLSRAFWCPRTGPTDYHEKFEGRLAGWGEFLELRTLVRSALIPSRFITTGFYKVLLPDDPQRSAETSFLQTKQLLSEIALVYRNAGESGLAKFISEYKLTTICDQQYQESHVGIDFGPNAISSRSETDTSLSGVSLRFSIHSTGAHAALYSQNNSAHPLVDISIDPGPRAKALSAAQVRCCLGLIDCITLQRWTPSNRYERRALVALSLCCTSTQLSDGASQTATPNADTLESIGIKASSLPSPPETFFTKEVLRAIHDDPGCVVPKEARTDMHVVTEALKGARWMALALSPNLRFNRPELFSELTLFHLADGTLKVHAHSDLGFSVHGITQLSNNSGTTNLRSLADELYSAFSEQSQVGWSLVYDTIQRISGSANRTTAAGMTAHNLPAALDETDRKSVATAGRLAFVLLRGGDYRLKCVLSPSSKKLWRLTVSSEELRGAVDVLFNAYVVTEIRFRHIAAAAGSRPSWHHLGTIRSQNTDGNPLSHEILLTCLRSYFRDRISPQASFISNPEQLVFEKIARLVHPEGFGVLEVS
jgi:hypothetical protein